MKKQILLSSALMLIIVMLLSSCSSSYMARSGTHLDLVKTGKKLPNTTVTSQNTIKKESTVMNMMSSNQENQLSLDQPIGYASVQSPSAAKETNDAQANTPNIRFNQAASATFGKVVSIGNSLNVTTSLKAAGLTDDPDKLLLLWIIFAAVAIVFSVFSVFTYAPVLWAIGALCGLAATVFFILWLLALFS